MKFESQFGLGEIVCTKQIISGDRIRQDVMGEVIGIAFGKNGETGVHVRLSDGNVFQFMTCELIGDPAFDQETGTYPTTD